MEELQKGQKVRVRSDIKEHEKRENPGITEEMEELMGQVVTIRKAMGNRYYKLEEDNNNYNWITNWFEPISEEEDIING